MVCESRASAAVFPPKGYILVLNLTKNVFGGDRLLANTGMIIWSLRGYLPATTCTPYYVYHRSYYIALSLAHIQDIKIREGCWVQARGSRVVAQTLAAFRYTILFSP